MNIRQHCFALLSAVLISSSLIPAPAHADAQLTKFLSTISQAKKIKRGFHIAPVPLDLGSYIVNAQGAATIATRTRPMRLAAIHSKASRSRSMQVIRGTDHDSFPTTLIPHLT